MLSRERVRKNDCVRPAAPGVLLTIGIWGNGTSCTVGGPSCVGNVRDSRSLMPLEILISSSLGEPGSLSENVESSTSAPGGCKSMRAIRFTMKDRGRWRTPNAITLTSLNCTMSYLVNAISINTKDALIHIL